MLYFRSGYQNQNWQSERSLGRWDTFIKNKSTLNCCLNGKLASIWKFYCKPPKAGEYGIMKDDLGNGLFPKSDRWMLLIYERYEIKTRCQGSWEIIVQYKQSSWDLVEVEGVEILFIPHLKGNTCYAFKDTYSMSPELELTNINIIPSGCRQHIQKRSLKWLKLSLSLSLNLILNK
jgi:hypothetical protein